jgi:Peptidase family C25
MGVDKLIITNRNALQNKYGSQGFQKIRSAIKQLIAADKKRNINSLLVFVDDHVAMKKAKGKTVNDITDAEQNKNAIDSLFHYHTPDYLMLLGAQDVIPHCRFRIPIPDDDDTFVASDVPYACEAPFSRNAGDFIAPGRVLGRLPDITAGSDPSYLINLLHNSIDWKPLKLSSYKNYFSLSVKWWKKSTKISLNNIFDNSTRLQLAPPTDGPYSKTDLKAMMHFFNCHGGLRTSEFYGQPNEKSSSFPVCLESHMLTNKISYGTVIAAECCYAGLLYNPNRPTKIHLPIANTYLQNNAIAFVGSTTAAYGPADSQGGADYITQYFLIALQKGASTGRAFLEAQQRFVEKGDVKMDPTDLKTVIQFLLLGDPSLTPVEDNPKTTPGKTAVKTIMNKDVHDIRERKDRRIKLAQKSSFIKSTTQTPVKIEARLGGTIKKEIKQALRAYKFKDGKKIVYGFKKKKRTAVKTPLNDQHYRYHVYSDVKRGGVIDTMRLLVIQEIDNKVTEVKEYVRR